MVNHYHILGVSEEATSEEIRGAFKRLAVKYHPDKHQGHPGMEEKFKEINTAYQILSNEYEKARYDLKLKYQQFSQAEQHQAYQNTRRKPASPFSPGGRPRYRRPYTQVDYKQNAIATAYAFGITFAIALVVMSVVWAKESYDARQLEKLLAERRNNYEEALSFFKNGHYRPAFEIMSEMKFFRNSEDDMRQFKENMVERLILKGNDRFSAQDYGTAIALYEMVLDLEISKQINAIKEKLAVAYAANEQPENAIEILQSFLVDEYKTIHSLVRIAEIQTKQLDQPKMALENLLTAHRLAIKRYKAFYGEGYALVINEEYVPESHFHLYRHLANQYLRIGDFEMAIKASIWNKYVWPDSAAAYVTTAEALIAQGKESEACSEYFEAKNRNWKGRTLIRCQ